MRDTIVVSTYGKPGKSLAPLDFGSDSSYGTPTVHSPVIVIRPLYRQNLNVPADDSRLTRSYFAGPRSVFGA